MDTDERKRAIPSRRELPTKSNEADEFIQQKRARGILLSTDNHLHNVIKINPPMVLNIGDVDLVLRTFEDVLSNF